jgi:hypothetical protein
MYRSNLLHTLMISESHHMSQKPNLTHMSNDADKIISTHILYT